MYDIPDPGRVLIVDCSRWQDDPYTENLIDFEIMKSSHLPMAPCIMEADHRQQSRVGIA